MHGGKSSDTSVNELLKEGHAEALMALSSRPKSKFIKAANQFNGYVSNLNHDQKHVTSFSKSRRLVFIFDFKIELDSSSFSVLATKLLHIAVPRVDIRNLLLRSLVFGLL